MSFTKHSSEIDHSEADLPSSFFSNNTGEENDSKELHVLTLTPFYPFHGDETSGCFIAEPLTYLRKQRVNNSVMAVRPVYRGRAHASHVQPAAQWVHYLTPPSAIGLPISGAFLYARLLPQVRLLHQRNPIDLIHAHAPLPCGHAAALLARELCIPYVVSVHGLDAYSTHQVKGLPGVWCKRISQMVYGNARRVICISERVRQEVQKESRSARSEVVYNGVDAEVFSPAAQDKEEQPAPTVLSVGNLIPSKGHALLLRAVAELSVSHPALRCEIIGTGPEEGRLRQLAVQLGISGQVHFHPKKSRTETARAMQQCTIFALLSYYEGLGCVYLEAMATEKSVIACRGQGIGEIIRSGENGLLVGEADLPGTVRALAMLLGDSALRRTFGMLARRTILNRFTLEHQAARLAQVYRDSLE